MGSNRRNLMFSTGPSTLTTRKPSVVDHKPFAFVGASRRRLRRPDGRQPRGLHTRRETERPPPAVRRGSARCRPAELQRRGLGTEGPEPVYPRRTSYPLCPSGGTAAWPYRSGACTGRVVLAVGRAADVCCLGWRARPGQSGSAPLSLVTRGREPKARRRRRCHISLPLSTKQVRSLSRLDLFSAGIGGEDSCRLPSLRAALAQLRVVSQGGLFTAHETKVEIGVST
jgi:hypothetical protein